jgi:hypothetical protein
LIIQGIKLVDNNEWLLDVDVGVSIHPNHIGNDIHPNNVLASNGTSG